NRFPGIRGEVGRRPMNAGASSEIGSWLPIRKLECFGRPGAGPAGPAGGGGDCRWTSTSGAD
ncbi:MAG: hypothetical protein ACYCZY_02390, partial [Lacisediminihabitans sp.]